MVLCNTGLDNLSGCVVDTLFPELVDIVLSKTCCFLSAFLCYGQGCLYIVCPWPFYVVSGKMLARLDIPPYRYLMLVKSETTR